MDLPSLFLYSKLKREVDLNVTRSYSGVTGTEKMSQPEITCLHFLVKPEIEQQKEQALLTLLNCVVTKL